MLYSFESIVHEWEEVATIAFDAYLRDNFTAVYDNNLDFLGYERKRQERDRGYAESAAWLQTFIAKHREQMMQDDNKYRNKLKQKHK